MSGLRHPSFLPALLTMVLTTICSQAPAAPRVALVIGNASYAHAPALANPLNDAADVGAALGRLGFEVTRLENADRSSLWSGLQEFALAASASEVAVVFYAGHGIEVDQRNFLVPVDARLANDQDVEFEAVPLELVSRAVERASGLRLVILDACRENPFASKMQRAGATRSIGRGLARAEPPGDTLVAYAAKEGTVAADGDGRNSPYSEALLAHLEEPGLEVGLMFRKVRDSVVASTGGRQHPFVYGSLSSRGVYLAAAPALISGPSPASVPVASSENAGISTDSHAARAYEAAERVNTVMAFEAVVRRFPETVYADLAQAQIGKLAEHSTQAIGSGTAAGAAASASAAAASGAAQPASGAPIPAAPTPVEVESSLGLDRGDRRRVQQGLASLGYGPGPADGLFGARTRDAIRRYQGAKRFEATGYLTAEQSHALAELGEEEAQAKAKAEAERREAQRRADDAAFAGARSRGTAEAYGAYLEAYPSGRHVVQARRLRTETERLERERREKAPGQRFRDCAECPEVVVVPSGSFKMGSRSAEIGRSGNEGPVHRVTVGKAFAVGVYEVTFTEWDACRRDGGCVDKPGDRGWGRGKRPVINVSWTDAREYVAWLSSKTGKRYRLLSESEWEYVARAGTTTPFHYGSTVSTEQANYDGNYTYGSGRKGRYRKRTVPAGSFPANAFGLHDVHGNVQEWVEDCWHGNYNGAPTEGSAWTSGGDCSRRVLRGGSWYYGPQNLRSADRSWDSSGDRGSFAGFRVARTLN